MLAFCRIMPDVCRTSIVNRASLRDAGFIDAVVELLRAALIAEDEASATAAATAIGATCTANDGNKKAAAQLFFPDLKALAEAAQVAELAKVPELAKVVEAEKENQENQGTQELPEIKPGALCLLLDVLEKFPSTAALQTEAISALRTLIVDDDPRKPACTPSAVENREVILSEEIYPKMREAVQRALAVADAEGGPQIKLREQSMLLLRELARGQENIKDLAKPSVKLMPAVRAALQADNPRLVRAAMSVLRAFAFCEEVRIEISLSDETRGYVQALRKHISVPVVCEQAFGLIANLAMRNPAMAAFLNDGDHELVALGREVLSAHPDRPDVAKSVIQLLWSVARHDDKALAEVRALSLFATLRKTAQEHKEEKRWQGAVETATQFLREFREDEGLQKKAVYNEFY